MGFKQDLIELIGPWAYQCIAVAPCNRMEQKPKRIRKSKWRTAAEANRKKPLDFEKPELAASSSKGSGPITALVALMLIAAIAAFFIVPSDAPPKANAPPRDEETITVGGLLPHQVITKFREASTFEEQLMLLEDPDLVEERARQFFAGDLQKNVTIDEITLKRRQNSSRSAHKFLHYTARLSNGDYRDILLNLHSGGAKIDFDFYSRYCDVPWSDFLDGSASESTQSRVILRKKHFYLGEFSDDTKWQSFEALSPDLEENIIVYLDRSSPSLESILRLNSTNKLRANLALKTTDASRKNRQFEIKKINALSWMTLKKTDE